ncbi:MAG TPA: helix-turn-helix domain-containing protein [Solirubrobacterales bacterium]|nr:helix-turn-helix domain-containing protein [Solirubrobacterales bacterium]
MKEDGHEQDGGGRRRYRKRRRAAQEDATRRRITEAAVDLHGSVGPAKTTVSAVAERAGVQRATVYRHFPDEAALFAACSAHWMGEHPLPDLAAWAAVADPERRLREALGELYAWFERGERMLEKTTRDVAVVPAMRPAMEGSAMWAEAAAETLMRGRRERGSRRRRVRAAIGHALSFATWRSLVREQGLSEAEAVELMIGLARL